jgi:predicted nucleic acid-binding protein
MNVVDSSGWLEYFASGSNSSFFAPPILDVARLVVPSICLQEVFRRTLHLRGERDALQVAAQMQQGHLVPHNGKIALAAARIGYDLKLPLADSIVLATAREHAAMLWTQDADFKGVAGVRYVAKRP